MRKTLLASLAIATLLASRASLAEDPGRGMGCAKPDQIAATLRDDYAEQPVATGVQENGALLQVWASKGGATWTVVVTLPTRLSCIVAAGKSWELAPVTAGGDGPTI